jgi:hypothetical protein
VKVFAEFYINSTGWNGTDYSGPVKLVPHLGSDGYLPLDGRLSIHNLHHAAQSAALRHINRSYIKGYRLFRGNLRQPTPISHIVELQP